MFQTQNIFLSKISDNGKLLFWIEFKNKDTHSELDFNYAKIFHKSMP